MAIPSWLRFAPQSGNGDESVNVSSASAHTGRLQRSYAATVTAGELQRTINVVQQAKPEFVTFDSNTASVDKQGGTLTITGKSNSNKLTFSFPGQNELGLAPVTTYNVAGAQATSGSEIAGDPGATAEYTFSVTFTGIPENMTIEEKVSVLTVTDAGNTQDVDGDAIYHTITITQAEGDAYLWVEETDKTETTVTLSAEGTAVAVQVLSNTNWSIA